MWILMMDSDHSTYTLLAYSLPMRSTCLIWLDDKIGDTRLHQYLGTCLCGVVQQKGIELCALNLEGVVFSSRVTDREIHAPEALGICRAKFSATLDNRAACDDGIEHTQPPEHGRAEGQERLPEVKARKRSLFENNDFPTLATHPPSAP